MASTLTCLHCGEGVRGTDRFCSRCGADLAATSHAAGLVQDYSHPDDDPESPWAEVVQRLRRATFGEYEIGRELGRGGMAAVFLAHDVSLDREVAIKVMSPGLLMGEGMIERFKREAITIAHLNHPNIVSCYSVRQAEGLHFFVMRCIQGRSLEQVIRDAGRLPLPIVRSILCQVGSALTYAHRSRVVHRDIKPANILIDVDGNAVVTDFGIAKVAKLPGHTHTGALVGTPAYMSPEQCAGGEVTGATDQYALGAVAYEMITGTAPFSGSTLTVMQAQVERPPAPIREHCPDCPPDFEAAVLRMLAKDPAERFPSMAEAKAALAATPLMESDPLLAELCRLAATNGSPAQPEVAPASTAVPRARRSTAQSGVAGPARSIAILPPPAELAVGEGFALIALVRGERGVPLPGRAVEWSTDAPDVLHLDQARKSATAIGPGTAMLTAACDGIEAQVRVLVPLEAAEPLQLAADHRAAAVQLSMPPKSVRAGDSFVLTALPLDHSSRPLPDAAVLWSSSDVRVAVVTAEGWVAALGRGQVVLTATSGLASGSVTLYVEQAQPAPRPAVPPRASPPPAVVEPEPVHRSSWRRRGARTRRRLLTAAVAGVSTLGSVWLFERLGDFRLEQGAAAAPSDTIPGVNAALAAAIRPESIPPINRGAAASRIRPRIRRPLASPDTSVSGMPAASSLVAAMPARPGSRAEADTAPTLPLEGVQLALGDTPAGDAPALGDGVPDVSGYAPMAPTAPAAGARLEPAPPSSVRRERPPVVGPVEPLTPAERRKLESEIRHGVEDCYEAVRSKDLRRITELYAPKAVGDEEKLRRLIRILRTEPWRATVERRVDGVRELGARTAAAEFSFRLTWRDSFGGRLSSHPIFRAEFALDGNDWTMSSCRIVGSPKL